MEHALTVHNPGSYLGFLCFLSYVMPDELQLNNSEEEGMSLMLLTEGTLPFESLFAFQRRRFSSLQFVSSAPFWPGMASGDRVFWARVH